MNFFGNFIKHETNTSNDKDPPCMKKQIETLIAKKKAFYKRLKQKMLNFKLLDELDAFQA